MLELQNLSVTLGKRKILRDVCLSLRQGRVAALLGRNGSGKTTLLRAVCREIPFRGTVTVNGSDTAILPPRERAKQVAVLPQHPPMTDHTVKELVMLGRTPYLGLLSRPAPSDREAVHLAMREADVLPLAERTVASLSGGERQKAYLAMLLAQDTPCVLLDEPTSYLDADAKRQLLANVKSLAAERNKAVLTVLHDLNDAIRVADDVLLLSDGELIFSGSVAEFIASDLATLHFGLARNDSADVLPFYY